MQNKVVVGHVLDDRLRDFVSKVLLPRGGERGDEQALVASPVPVRIIWIPERPLKGEAVLVQDPVDIRGLAGKGKPLAEPDPFVVGPLCIPWLRGVEGGEAV